MPFATVAPAQADPVRHRAAAMRGTAPWLLPAVLCAILVLPLLLVAVPPVLDYPNHLARLYVLAFGADDPDLARMYAAHWSVIPNLAIDLIGPPLLRVLPVHVAGRLLLAAVLVLPVLGTIAYARAVWRDSSAGLSWWPAASVLVACNGVFLLGFLNFLIGTGLALLFAAGWVRYRDTAPAVSIALGAVAAMLLFLCHLMGLVFFLILIASAEADWLVARVQRRDPWLGDAVRRAAAMLPLLVPPAILYRMTALEAATGDVKRLPLFEKLTQGFVAFVNYDVVLDTLTAAIVVGFIGGCLVLGRGMIARKSLLAVCVLPALYAASPFIAKGTCFLDTRLPIMFGFLLFAAFTPVRLPRRAGYAVAFAALSLFLVRTGVVASVWHAHDRDMADLRSIIAEVPAGSRVLVTTVSPEENPQYWRDGPRARRLSNGQRTDFHFAAMLLLDRHAFWPFLFASPAQQPIRLRSPYRELALRTLNMPEHHKLASDYLPSAADLEASPVLADWTRQYDYVLMLEAGGEPHLAGFAADRLELLGHHDIAALFRVRPPQTDPALARLGRERPDA